MEQNLYSNGKFYLSVEMCKVLDVETRDKVFMRLIENKIVIEKHQDVCHLCGVTPVDDEDAGICYKCTFENADELSKKLYGVYIIQKPRMVHISKKIRESLKLINKDDGLASFDVEISEEKKQVILS